jgi:hypothetical protein
VASFAELIGGDGRTDNDTIYMIDLKYAQRRHLPSDRPTWRDRPLKFVGRLMSVDADDPHAAGQKLFTQGEA